MSATMAKQGGRVQLEQSGMSLALNMAKMPKWGFLRATMEETQYLINKPQAEVREEKKRGDDCTAHENGRAAMGRHPPMLRENQTVGCLPCLNGTAQNSQTLWRCKDTGAPPPERVRQLTPEPTPHPPGMPPVPPGDNDGAHTSETEGVPPRYVYIRTPLPSTHCINLDAYSKDRKRNKHFNPDLLTDEGTSTC